MAQLELGLELLKLPAILHRLELSVRLCLLAETSASDDSFHALHHKVTTQQIDACISMCMAQVIFLIFLRITHDAWNSFPSSTTANAQ